MLDVFLLVSFTFYRGIHRPLKQPPFRKNFCLELFPNIEQANQSLYVPGSKLPLISMVGDDHEPHSVSWEPQGQPPQGHVETPRNSRP